MKKLFHTFQVNNYDIDKVSCKNNRIKNVVSESWSKNGDSAGCCVSVRHGETWDISWNEVFDTKRITAVHIFFPRQTTDCGEYSTMWIFNFELDLICEFCDSGLRNLVLKSEYDSHLRRSIDEFFLGWNCSPLFLRTLFWLPVYP